MIIYILHTYVISMHCVPAFRIVSESLRGNQAANLGGWSCAIADRWSFQISPPSEGHPAIWGCFELAFYPGFGWFRFMTHWQGVETTFGSPVSRCPGLTWLGGQRTTFAGEHSLGDLFEVERQWPIAFRWSFRCLPQWGSHVLGWHDHFYIQESGIYSKCDISSST